MREDIKEIVKSTLLILRSTDSNEVEIMKARKRNDGETWTQPSGRKVTKRGGKIIPLSNNNNSFDSKYHIPV
jgi:hypothetical protein